MAIVLISHASSVGLIRFLCALSAHNILNNLSPDTTRYQQSGYSDLVIRSVCQSIVHGVKSLKCIILSMATSSLSRNVVKHVMFTTPESARRPLQESYEVGPEIGRGSYGNVFEATRRDTGQVCAVKVISKDKV